MNRLHHKRLVAAAYLLALAAWLAHGAGALVQGAWYAHRGQAPSVVLAPQDLELSSLVPYEGDDGPVEGCLVSTDSDPHLFWRHEAWVDTVTLDVGQNKPAGGVELYYLLPGQQEFTANQVVYPSRDAQGRYVFELGGKLVAGLRVDPDSVGGVVTQFRGMAVNPHHAWYRHFVPSAGQGLLLLALPLLAAALVAEIASLLGLPRR